MIYLTQLITQKAIKINKLNITILLLATIIQIMVYILSNRSMINKTQINLVNYVLYFYLPFIKVMFVQFSYFSILFAIVILVYFIKSSNRFITLFFIYACLILIAGIKSWIPFGGHVGPFSGGRYTFVLICAINFIIIYFVTRCKNTVYRRILTTIYIIIFILNLCNHSFFYKKINNYDYYDQVNSIVAGHSNKIISQFNDQKVEWYIVNTKKHISC